MPTIPDALALRTLKYGQGSEAERERVAGILRQAGRHTEALLLYEGRGQHPELRQVKARALAQGLAFSLLTLQRLGAEVTQADFRAGARAAEAAGRWLDARQCHVAAGDLEEVRRIAPHLPSSYAPPPPPPPPPAAAPGSAPSAPSKS